MRYCSVLRRLSQANSLFQNAIPSLVRFTSETKSSEDLSTSMEWTGPLPETQLPSKMTDLVTDEDSASGGDPHRGIKRQRESGLIDGPILASEFRVSRTTYPQSFSRVLVQILRTKGSCRVLTSGDEALNQFIKGIANTRILIHRRNEGDVCFQASHSFWHDRNSTNQLVIDVKRVETELEKSEKCEKLRVRRDTDMRPLSKQIKHCLQKSDSVEIYAMGIRAISTSILAFIWSRRHCMTDGFDIDCYASFQQVPGLDPARFKLILLTLVSRKMSKDLNSAKSEFAILPFQFSSSKMDLKSMMEVFGGKKNVDLPIVKISAETHPNKAASALITYLRSCNGVQLFSSGSIANNQAFKAITVCRNYIRELDGFDLGFQSIHAPRANRNGECQVVSRIQLIADTSQIIQSLEGEQIEFKIGNMSDAKNVGLAMAGQIKFSKRIHCAVSGAGAAARFLVALSHARIQLAPDKMDLVALPLFEASQLINESTGRSLVFIGVEILSIQSIN
eukprot:g817.t1